MSASIFEPEATPATVAQVASGQKVYVSQNKKDLPTIEVRADQLFFNWQFSRWFMGKFGDGCCIGFTIKDRHVAFYFGAERQPEEKYTEFLVSIEPMQEGYLLKIKTQNDRDKLDLLIGAIVSTYKTSPIFMLRFEDGKGMEHFAHKRIWKLVKKFS